MQVTLIQDMSIAAHTELRTFDLFINFENKLTLIKNSAVGKWGSDPMDLWLMH